MPSGETRGDAVNSVVEAQQRGDVLLAYDRAMRALAETDGDAPDLEYHAVLALARSGAIRDARKLYDRFGLGDSTNEDIACLLARVAKEEARESHGQERTRLYARSAELYEAVYQRTRGFFPGINVATMSLLSGDRERSRIFAASVLEELEFSSSTPGSDEYFREATRAEAFLLLGDPGAAQRAVEDAVALQAQGPADLNTTWRQLKLVCEASGIDVSVLRPLEPPAVIYYCGPLIEVPRELSSVPLELEAEIARAIRRSIAERRPGVGFGSLASGVDILFAEALLECGAELNIVLPFNVDEFKRISVTRGGEVWEARFETCLRAAESVTLATEDEYFDDEVLFQFGSRMAMGLAILRARQMEAPVLQMAVSGADTSSTTAHSVAYWKALELPAELIEFDAPALPRKRALERASHAGRQLRAILFADIKGFSRLPERSLTIYWSEVMQGFAEVLDAAGRKILLRNTWGDALYVVFEDTPAAARCALALHDFMRETRFEAHGLPRDLSLRIGGHYAPIFSGHDPVAGRATYYGSQVSRTARIEPITPPGQLYVTEAFAAVLAAEAPDEFVSEYVGVLPAAKGYGDFRMYRVRRG